MAEAYVWLSQRAAGIARTAGRTLSLLGLGLGLAAASPAAVPVVSGYPETVAAPAGLRAGDLAMQPCLYRAKADGQDYGADCGRLVVPENRHAPGGGRLIVLPLIRIRATGPRLAEPIFTFQGGPGAANAIRFSIASLLARHDVVMVGYRGVDGSVKLDCPEVAEHIASAKGPLMGPESMASFRTGPRLCAERLARQGIDLAGYSMPQTIDDQEAARKALGYGPIDLLGGSYGTRLEMIYMWRYPASLRRVVMLGVNPPGNFVWNPALTEAKLARYGALCAADGYCRKRTGDLTATLHSVSANMPPSWLGVPIDPDRVRFLSFFMLHESIDPKTAPLALSGPAAIDMWLDAAHGDASGMALLSSISHVVMPHMINTWGQFFAMGYSDYAALTPDQLRRLDVKDVVVGAPSRLFWEMGRDWPPNADAGAYNTVQRSDVETLLISGTLDVTTPLENARDELLPSLSRGHLVPLAEFGHTASFWGSQPKARDRLLNTFFDSGRVDASLYVRQPPVFRVTNGPNALVSHLLAFAGVFVVALAAAIWLAISALRRGKRRRFSPPAAL